jgi:hypothetical protein
VTLLLHGFDCGMIRLWATVTIHQQKPICFRSSNRQNFFVFGKRS